MKTWFAFCLLILIGAPLPRASASGPLSFKPAGTNEFAFDTGCLRGKFRAGGASKGLSEVEHVQARTRIDSSMGLFSPYRILSENKRYGDAAWKWPSDARLGPDGSVTVSWPAAADRPFELGATYKWVSPDTLELQTTFRAVEAVQKAEVFLSSYFSAGFTNAAIWAGTGARASALLPALEEHGTWLCYPRDAAALAIVRDGRWTHPPSPVEWTRPADYVQPLAIRRAPAQNLAALVMASPSDCYSVMAPHQTENHRSLYLALFGRDARAGEVLKARAWLVITTNVTDAAAIGMHKEFTGTH